MRKILIAATTALVIALGSWTVYAWVSTPMLMGGRAVSSQTIFSISLSNQTFTNSSANATVGSVSVVMSPVTPAFSGTLTLTGTNSGAFHLVGAGCSTGGGCTLETNAAGTTSGTYTDVNIVATQAGISNSPRQISPTLTGSGGGTIACAYGPSFSGTIPAPAVRAGYTTCVANYDFSVTSSFTDLLGTHTWTDVTSWLANGLNVNQGCSSTTPLWYNTGYNSPATSCSDWTIINDATLGHNVLDMAYTAADAAINASNTWMSQQNTFGGSFTAGYSVPQALYIETTTELLPAGVNVFSGTVCDTAYCELSNFFSLLTGISGFVEWDFIESDASHVWQNNTGQYFTTITPFGSYHNYGELITLNADQSQVSNCAYLDGSPAPSAPWGPTGNCWTNRGNSFPNATQIWGVGPGSGNYCPGGSGHACPAPNQTQHMRISYIRIFSCANWQPKGATPQTACNGTYITTP